jgi:hypothetical protein
MNIGRAIGWALASAGLAAGVAIADDFGGSSFALPQDVVSAATAFEHFMHSAVRLDGGFTSGEAVAQGLRTAAAYEPSQLQEGMIAYGAIAALRDSRFVGGVEQAGRAEGRYALADRLVEDPCAASTARRAPPGGSLRR